MRQRADCRNEMAYQPRQSERVFLAIIENAAPFLRSERRPLQDPVAHLDLVAAVELVFPEETQSPGEAVKALRSITRFNPGVIHQMAELNVGVYQACRLSPALR